MSKVAIAVDESGSYRTYLTVTTDLVEKARLIHNTSPLASAALGRVLTGTGLMSIMLKNDADNVTVQFTGDGPAKQIISVGHGDGSVKGYIADPQVELPLKNGKLDVGGSIGVGELRVIRDEGLKEPYTGSIALVSGEIAEDLTAYYYISEQQNTSIALGVKVEPDLSIGAAGGMFIQMMPDPEEEALCELEALTSHMEPVTSLIDSIAKGGKSEEGIVNELMDLIFKDVPDGFKPRIIGWKEINWNCDCSKEKMTAALMTIGEKDMKRIIDEDGKAELVCHFCNSKYDFNKEELEAILWKISDSK